MRIAVIGAGSWGTTLADLLATKGFKVDLWVREKEVYQQIREKRENKVFLPGIRLSERITPVMSFEEALDKKELAVVAVPSHVLRSVLRQMKPYIRDEIPFVFATKGIENDTLMLVSQIVEDVLSWNISRYFACIAGPSFAKEVACRFPTAVTIACRDLNLGRRLQELFFTEYFRVYLIEDIIGAQLGGALKNVIAIAAGASDGLNFGSNARAALITRGLAEIMRLGVAMGAEQRTFFGLAGMGDLVLTCTGELSRNRTVGFKIGKGMKLEEIISGMKMVAEGIKTAKAAYALSKKMAVEMPITEQVYQILYEGKDPKDAVKELMTRKLKMEMD
ncbi:MAG: NAD(P)H-dependent glycerol-3-phosphate dehydrogenase [Deltaproteobacteria bacterium]|nr:MAG: NAD(P)H-dependent glycerol-3-phosphate dehydrogenase [Deltaproteobacteria bacterium]